MYPFYGVQAAARLAHGQTGTFASLVVFRERKRRAHLARANIFAPRSPAAAGAKTRGQQRRRAIVPCGDATFFIERGIAGATHTVPIRREPTNYMKLTKKMILTAGLFAAGVSFAQTSTNSGGLLGQRYAELGFGVQDIKHISPKGYSLSASANTPVVANQLDAGASYDYSWIGGAFRGHANTIGGYATAYKALAGVKPFVSAALGYQWTNVRFVGSDDQALWGLAAGVEIPAGLVTITPRIAYADDFESSRNSSQALTYSVEASHWYNAKTAVFAGVGYTDNHRSSIDSWNYSVGVRVKF